MQGASDKAGRVLRNLTFVERSNHVERSTAKSLTNQKIGHSGSFKEQELLTKRNVTLDRLHISVKVSGHGAHGEPKTALVALATENRRQR